MFAYFKMGFFAALLLTTLVSANMYLKHGSAVSLAVSVPAFCLLLVFLWQMHSEYRTKQRALECLRSLTPELTHKSIAANAKRMELSCLPDCSNIRTAQLKFQDFSYAYRERFDSKGRLIQTAEVWTNDAEGVWGKLVSSAEFVDGQLRKKLSV